MLCLPSTVIPSLFSSQIQHIHVHYLIIFYYQASADFLAGDKPGVAVGPDGLKDIALPP